MSPSAGALAWVGAPSPWRIAGLEPSAEDLRDAERHPEALRPAFLRRRLTLRRFLADALGGPAEAMRVACDPVGRPTLPGAPDTFVSTAHRPGLLALAVARAPVGIDVEPLDDPAEPAWNILSPAERRGLELGPLSGRWLAFLRLWTAKEAYVKALGVGLRREPAGIEVRVVGRTLHLRDEGRAVAATAALMDPVGPHGACAVAACVVLAG